MKILISVDIEGVAGVFNVEQTRPGNGEYERARRWMTEEANAAIRGAFAGGATEVLVNDSHGSFRNLLADSLDPRARFVLGKPRYLGMMGGLDTECDGVMLIGYHSRAQGRGILAHTINSFAFARVTVNGRELGEAGLYGALAAESECTLFSGRVMMCSSTRTVTCFPARAGSRPRLPTVTQAASPWLPAKSRRQSNKRPSWPFGIASSLLWRCRRHCT